MAPLTRAQAEAIVEAGVLAPSADNRHMLRFEISAASILLWETDEFATAPPHRRVLGLISLGAVVENMVLRSTHLGLDAEVSWSLEGSRREPIASLRLSRGQTSESELQAAIALRHTNRRLLFRGPRLSPVQERQLAEEVRSVAGARLVWLDTPELRPPALRLVTMAEAERFRHEPLHRELFSAIRFDIGWKTTCEELLPPGALEVEPLLRLGFAALRDFRLMRWLKRLGIHRMLGLRAGYLPCRLAPHLGVIATDIDLERGAIAVGRAFERLWLRACIQGVALQPFAAAAVLAFEESSRHGASDRVRAALTAGWKSVLPGLTPLMVFRLGRALPPTVTAGRRPVAAYVRAALPSRAEC